MKRGTELGLVVCAAVQAAEVAMETTRRIFFISSHSSPFFTGVPFRLMRDLPFSLHLLQTQYD
jgi:hypothetical protein